MFYTLSNNCSQIFYPLGTYQYSCMIFGFISF